VDRSRYFLIGLAVLLMAALVAVVGQSLTAGREPARVMPVVAAPTPTPAKPSSVMGVSTTRIGPNSSSRPRLTL